MTYDDVSAVMGNGTWALYSCVLDIFFFSFNMKYGKYQ